MALMAAQALAVRRPNHRSLKTAPAAAASIAAHPVHTAMSRTVRRLISGTALVQTADPAQAALRQNRANVVPPIMAPIAPALNQPRLFVL